MTSLKKYVFLQVLKLGNKLLCLIMLWGEFHKLGAAKEKHLWPQLTSLMGGIFSKFLEGGLRFLVGA